MVYEFMGKVKSVGKIELFDVKSLKETIAEINAKFEEPLDITILTGQVPPRDILIKAKASVSSFYPMHDDELTKAIGIFKDYLEAIASMAEGEVSRTEGFYNNTKTFSRLW